MGDTVRLPGNEERWIHATSLRDTIFRMVQEKKTLTPEFQSLMAYYGRPKMVKLYREALAENGILPLNAVGSALDNGIGDEILK